MHWIPQSIKNKKRKSPNVSLHCPCSTPNKLPHSLFSTPLPPQKNDKKKKIQKGHLTHALIRTHYSHSQNFFPHLSHPQPIPLSLGLSLIFLKKSLNSPNHIPQTFKIPTASDPSSLARHHPNPRFRPTLR